MHLLFTQLKKMYDYELYAQVIPIAKILLTSYAYERSNLAPELLNTEEYFLTLIYYANSLYQEQSHRKAEEIYRIAMLARTNYFKHRATFPAIYDSDADQYTDTEIRYRRAQCLQAIKQYPEAITTLQSIPTKQRPPKVNMLLSKLLQRNGYDKSAAIPLKAALKECPLNLDAIKGLLAIGVKMTEINLLMNNADISLHTLDWLNSYITAYSNIYACKFSEAINSLKAIEGKPDIGGSEIFQILLGQCYHYQGNYDMAINYLQRVYHNSTFMTDGLMDLATLYAIKNRTDDLEKLTQPAYQISEYTAEHWYVLAQHLFCQAKYEKAAFFVQKSWYMKAKNVEAGLLKVKIFMALKKYKEAIQALRVLEQYASYRFELYENFVEAYILSNRLREAQEISRTGVRRHGPNISTRSLILLAKPYFHHDERSNKMKATNMIKQALKRDEYYLPAVYMLYDILQEEGDVTGAKKLIEKQLAVQPNSKLFSMLGDLQSQERDLTKAVENYTIAINMDPSNRKAVAGLIAMGQSMVTKTEPDEYTAPTPSEEATDYENALEIEIEMPSTAPGGNIESESDSMWSDVEIDVTNA